MTTPRFLVRKAHPQTEEATRRTGSQETEILSSHLGFGFTYFVRSQEINAYLADELGQGLVVGCGWIARRNFELVVTTQGTGHATGPLQFIEELLPYLRLETADRARQLYSVSHDVGLGPALDSAHGDDSAVEGADTPGDNGLDSHNHLGSQDDSVGAFVGIGTVAGLSQNGRAKGIGGSHHRARQ